MTKRILFILLFFAVGARAQVVLYADKFSGEDMGEKIAKCLAALPETGGICDARNFTGEQKAAVGFAVGSSHQPVELLLGPMTLLTSETIHVQAKSSILGMPAGMGIGTYQSATMIKAANGTALNAVVQVDGPLAVLQDLTVDGNRSGAPRGAVGILINKAGRVELFRVTAQNSPKYGIELYSTENNESCCAKLSKVMAIANGDSGLHLANTGDVFISLSEFENNGTHGLEVNNSPALRLEHSDVGGNVADGIRVYGTADSHLKSNDEIIVGNQFGNNGQHDIHVLGFDDKAKKHTSTGHLISSNEFIGSDKRLEGFDAIHIMESGGNNIIGNTFFATRAHPYRSCIYIQGDHELKDQVTGNFCHAIDFGGKAAYFGVATTVFTDNQPPNPK